jgi:hypothetical protein
MLAHGPKQIALRGGDMKPTRRFFAAVAALSLISAYALLSTFGLATGEAVKPRPVYGSEWIKAHVKDRHIRHSGDATDSYYLEGSMLDTLSGFLGESVRWNLHMKAQHKFDAAVIVFWWKTPFDSSVYHFAKDPSSGQITATSSMVLGGIPPTYLIVYPYSVKIWHDGKKKPEVIDPGIIVEDPAPGDTTGHH